MLLHLEVRYSKYNIWIADNLKKNLPRSFDGAKWFQNKWEIFSNFVDFSEYMKFSMKNSGFDHMGYIMGR